LNNLTRAERKVEFQKEKTRPETPKWQYENPAGEAELAERYGENQHLQLALPKEIQNG
jgi:hypothetical protein